MIHENNNNTSDVSRSGNKRDTRVRFRNKNIKNWECETFDDDGYLCVYVYYVCVRSARRDRRVAKRTRDWSDIFRIFLRAHTAYTHVCNKVSVKHKKNYIQLYERIKMFYYNSINTAQCYRASCLINNCTINNKDTTYTYLMVFNFWKDKGNNDKKQDLGDVVFRPPFENPAAAYVTIYWIRHYRTRPVSDVRCTQNLPWAFFCF